MFQWAGMRKGEKPLPLAFYIWFLWYEDLVILIWSWYLHWLQNAKTFALWNIVSSKIHNQSLNSGFWNCRLLILLVGWDFCYMIWQTLILYVLTNKIWNEMWPRIKKMPTNCHDFSDYLRRIGRTPNILPSHYVGHTCSFLKSFSSLSQ